MGIKYIKKLNNLNDVHYGYVIVYDDYTVDGKVNNETISCVKNDENRHYKDIIKPWIDEGKPIQEAD
jgi:hypothetical protein